MWSHHAQFTEKVILDSLPESELAVYQSLGRVLANKAERMRWSIYLQGRATLCEAIVRSRVLKLG